MCDIGTGNPLPAINLQFSQTVETKNILKLPRPTLTYGCRLPLNDFKIKFYPHVHHFARPIDTLSFDFSLLQFISSPSLLYVIWAIFSTIAHLFGAMHGSSTWVIYVIDNGIHFRQCWRPCRNRLPVVDYMTRVKLEWFCQKSVQLFITAALIQNE